MLTIGNQSESDADAPEGVSAFLALGGNLGDREAVFRDALRRLRENGFAVEAVSSFYETAPVGCEPGAPAFYNAVVRGRWSGSPEALLKLCLKLEAEAGRPVDHPHWHSRILDLDLILFGDRILATEFLTVPHPRAHERLFVMVPLAEIAPEAVSPTLHRSASAILHSLDSRGEMPRRVKDASGKGC